MQLPDLWRAVRRGIGVYDLPLPNWWTDDGSSGGPRRGRGRSTLRPRREWVRPSRPGATFGEEAEMGRPGSGMVQCALLGSAAATSRANVLEGDGACRCLAAPGLGGTAALQRAGAAGSAPSHRSGTFGARAPTTPPDAGTTGTDPADPPDERPVTHSTPQSLGTQLCQSWAQTPPQPARRRTAPHEASHSWSDAHWALMWWPRSWMTRVRLWPGGASGAGSYAGLDRT